MTDRQVTLWCLAVIFAAIFVGLISNLFGQNLETFLDWILWLRKENRP